MMTNRHNKDSRKPRDGTEIFSNHYKNDKGFHYQCFKICEMKEPCHAVIWKNDNLILRNILI